ncbi:MAG: potassium channel family protein [Bacillota bacterium]
MQTQNKIYLVMILMFITIAGGSVGFIIIEDMSPLESLYMTIITISTVGFGEVRELSDAGRFFTIILIFSGLFIAAFAVTAVSSFIIEGELRYLLRRRTMEKKVRKLKKHYIICGAGDTGNYIVNQFRKRKKSYVVIDKDPAKVESVIEQGGVALIGDATLEEDLLKAGIEDAKGLLCCLSTDADNVFTVLTAREMKPDLFIVSRAIDDKADRKLLKAGADKTVSPNEIGGVRMASLILRPAVVSFLDVIVRAGDLLIDLEEVRVKKGSEMAGQNLAEVRIPERTGLVVLAVKRAGDDTIINPGPNFKIKSDDKLIVLGQENQVEKLQAMAN